MALLNTSLFSISNPCMEKINSPFKLSSMDHKILKTLLFSGRKAEVGIQCYHEHDGISFELIYAAS